MKDDMFGKAYYKPSFAYSKESYEYDEMIARMRCQPYWHDTRGHLMMMNASQKIEGGLPSVSLEGMDLPPPPIHFAGQLPK